MGAEITTKERADLSVTALYTSFTWHWAGFDGADLFVTPESKAVFAWTNGALALVRFFRRSIPSLKHSLAQRHLLIDRVVKAQAPVQILEIAAGLSRRGASLSDDPAIDYVELDLGPVVERKRALLSRTERGRAVLARKNYRLVSGDARTVALESLVDVTKPVTVVAEGLLMYLNAGEQRALFERIANLIAKTPGGAFVFDLVPFVEQPKPGVLGRTLELGLKMFTRGKSLELDARTRDDIARDLASAGFGEVAMIEPSSAPPDWAVPHLEERTQTLIFIARSRS